ncbi:MAG: hypothetical protein V7K97_18100 [Nostoc sp.]|uniref:hypothetical protein n=1 Tax=Nostoc sp. TaxID=1180 RepID=UPI002FF87334
MNNYKAGYRLINIAFTPSNGWALLDLSPQEIIAQNELAIKTNQLTTQLEIDAINNIVLPE